MTSAAHGGDVQRVAALYGIDPSGLIDFSANIDPHGPPPAVADILARAAANPRWLSAYPSRRAYDAACRAIAQTEDLDPRSIVLGAGGAALIDAAVRFAAVRSLTVPVPAFSEYARAVAAAGKILIEFPLPADLRLDPRAFLDRLALTDAGAVITTPHNPTGLALAREAVCDIVAWCEDRARDLIVDEAFVDYVPDRSVAAEGARSMQTTVVRSLTKFYALPGMRIGYAVLHPERAERMRAFLPSWPVGSIELAVAAALFSEQSHAPRTRARNAAEREALVRSLTAAGVTVFPSVANFLLLELPCRSLDAVLVALAREHGIVVRDCRSYRGLESRAMIRVAVLDASSNGRLVAALRDVLRTA